MNIKEIMQMLQEEKIDIKEAKRLLKGGAKELSSELTLKMVEDYIIETMTRVLKFDKEQLGLNVHVENFGVDSILSVKLTTEFEKDLTGLSKTLFFEYTTIRELANFFFNEKREELSRLLLKNEVQKPIAVGKRVEQAIEIETQEKSSGDIAIIGLSGKYPNSETPQELWENLIAERDLVSEILKDRFDFTPFFEAEKRLPGKIYSKWGGFIKNAGHFDLKLFKMAPIDARHLDPQVRMTMLAAWEALEDAGYTREGIREQFDSQVGVYIGGMETDYAFLTTNTTANFHPDALSADQANRISHFFDFEGPSLSINTLCSSALAAIHLARQSLLSGECKLAMAGGVNLIVHPQKYLGLCDAGLLSTDGRCRSFGEGGDGYVPCEGVGIVLLKKLEEALKDGDHIYGVIKGTAINNCGRVNSYRVPSPHGQAKVIKKAIEDAGVDPKNIGYIEAHGTGTKLGDPIEIEGLNKVFTPYLDAPSSCPIGSIKSNMGHAESAAGISGLTKVLLQFQHQTLVPSIHSDVLNSHIDFSRSPFYVQRSVEKWKRKTRVRGGETVEIPLLAGISSFGAGGVNLHVIVEEYVEKRPTRSISGESELILLSAMSEEQLVQIAGRLRNHLEKNPTIELRDVAYTLAMGREALTYRAAFSAQSTADLKDQLKAYEQGRVPSTWAVGKRSTREEDLEPLNPKGSSPIDLAKVWVLGRRVKWEQGFYGKEARKLSLPTYPFDLEHYWISMEELKPHPGIFEGEIAFEQKPPEQRADFSKTVFSTPVWTPSALQQNVKLREGYKKILLCPMEWESSLGGAGADIVRPLDLKRDATSIEQNLLDFVAFLQEKQKSKEILRASIILAAPEEKDLEVSPFAGFFKSLREENPSFLGKVLLMQKPSASEIDEEWLSHEPIVKKGNERLVQTMVEVSGEAGSLPLIKPGGVYWITGGAGGLGKLFAGYFGQKQVPATVILSGRSLLSPEKEKAIQKLQTTQLNVEYRSCDISDALSAKALVDGIQKDHQKLDGIIHSAGVLRDGLFIKKTEQDFRDVFAPKIHGVMNIETATQHLPLDYFLLFSSESSLFGNVGQTDYSAANHFLDAFPKHRKGSGICKAINWPLWESGGMQVPDQIVEMIRKETGMISLTTPIGTQALEKMLHMDADQIFICEGGEVDTIKEVFAIGKRKESAPQIQAPTVSSSIGEEIKTEIARLMEWEVSMIDEDASFQDFGMDSVRLGDLAQILSKQYAINLEPTIFFEYPILHEFITHLEQEMGEAIPQKAEDHGRSIKQEIANLMEWDVEMIDEDASFQDFGMDSVRLNDLAERLSGQFGVELPPTVFFEFPILHEFINHFSSLEVIPAKKPEAAVEQPAQEIYRIETPVDEPIAVTGIDCRFPKAKDMLTFWKNIKEGKDGVGKIPSHRSELKELVESDDRALHSGGYLDEVDTFDASFFGFSPKEAELMDPQQRLSLETVWHTIEDAGYNPADLAKSKTGLFFGVSSMDYVIWIGRSKVASPYIATGIGHSTLANRISYLLDLTGPSEPVNTACSSALVAIHRAIEAIRSGSASQAIVGGVNLILEKELSVGFRSAGMLSDDSKCKTFDAKANGYVRGEGVGAIFLKPLSQAKKNGDHIYGLIRGSAVNHGGRASSLTAPNPAAQADLIAGAYESAQVPMNTLGYIETHGTGTALGDPIEIEGLKKAYGRSEKGDVENPRCALGAVKTNLGHLESAAGIAGVIKSLLCLKEQTIVKNLHLSEVNPHIHLENTPFFFPSETEQWKPLKDRDGHTYPRRAGVSSFGYGGVNAHIICEEYIEKESALSEKAIGLFLLSAKTKEALQKLSQAYLNDSTQDFNGLLYTLQAGRSEMQHRLAILAEDKSSLIEKLKTFLEKGDDKETIFYGSAKTIRKSPAISSDATELAALWIKGTPIDWKTIYANRKMKRVSLPLYPFEKEHYFVGLPKEEKETVSFELSKEDFFFRDHVIAKGHVLPGVVYLDLIFKAYEQLNGHTDISIESLTWHMPLFATREKISLNVTFHQEGTVEVWKEGINQSKTVHCKARIGALSPKPSPLHLASLPHGEKKVMGGQEVYGEFEKIGFAYGPTFQVIEQIEKGEGELLVHVNTPEDARGEFVLHPATADGVLQALIGLDSEQSGAAMPLGFDRFSLFKPLPKAVKGLVKVKAGGASVDIFIATEEGDVIGWIENFHVKAIDPKDRKTEKVSSKEEQIAHLRKLISEETKLPLEKVGAKDDFELFGIDSFMGINLTRKLEETFGKLSKTIFYECQTIEELADELGDKNIENPVVEIEEEQTDGEGIAIIGVSGHYPSGETLDALWQTLIEGKSGITEIPSERWDHSVYYDPSGEEEGKTYGKWGGFIDDVDKFDPRFFNIPHGEAQFMDPQERLMLQATWEALENAGYSPRQFGLLNDKQVGVYMGLGYWDYQLYAAEETAKGNPQLAAANMAGVANRVSFFFNLGGPSFVLDTMCSSSLTALHLACESITRGETKAAIVGGINLNIHPHKFLILGQAQFLSKEGLCRTMGDGGDGFVPSEGVGCVILKSLKEAIRDCDRILGVIKGTAINHGGKVKGYTVPSPKAQTQVIEKALEKANVHPEEIQYIELHGTGTHLGDPIEITGLKRALCQGPHPATSCRIGSVKSNIGHCEAAAGIAGLTKVLLQMEKGQFVPSIHAEELNKEIDFEEIPFEVQRVGEKWSPGKRGRRVAALSSFGAGGSNAHVILEDYPTPHTSEQHSPQVIVLSAKDKEGLKSLSKELCTFLKGSDVLGHVAAIMSLDPQAIDSSVSLVDLGMDVSTLTALQERLGLNEGALKGNETIASLEKKPPFSLKEVAHTLRSGRELMKENVAFEAKDMDELIHQLKKLSHDEQVERQVDVDSLEEIDPRTSKRIALPTYPFKKERIWIDSQAEAITHSHSEKGINQLKEAIHALAKIPLDQLTPETSFEEIGLESVMIRKLAEKLSKTHPSIEKTAFFTYKTLGEFGDYLDGVEKVVKSQIPVHKSQEIAIVGMSGRLPMAENLEDFWENLIQKRDCIEEIPTERFDYRPYFSEEKEMFGKLYCKWGGFIDKPEDFDPLFFKISPDEARFMDPQERIFLEEAWKCLEIAGYSPKTMTRQVGVFAGATFNNYQLVGADAFGSEAGYPANSQTFSISNRVSYFMDFHGPSLTLDTACSSSLYAIHLACESIRRGECQMALAGGVNLSLHPSKYISLSMSGFAASDGKCHAFTEGGDGYVPGEGVGLILLKPLEEALADGDQIMGVIKGSAVSHDGRTHGYTVPNPVSQSSAIERALEVAGVSPESISYVEAHGTGTSLGDPIEIQGLSDVFRKYTDHKQFCAIGSVKSNIGHLESAAGIAQVLKVLCQFEHETIAPTLKHGEVNPELHMENTPFQVAFGEKSWKREEGKPRRAGISSFGAGGVNIHLILEEPPEVRPSRALAPQHFSKKRYSITDWSHQLKEQEQENVDLSSMSEVEQEEWLEQALCQLARSILGFEEGQTIDLNLGFFEMGMESVQGVKLQRGIEKLLNLKVSDTAIFDYPSIAKLRAHLMDLLKPEETDPLDEMEEDELAFALEQELASLNLED